MTKIKNILSITIMSLIAMFAFVSYSSGTLFAAPEKTAICHLGEDGWKVLELPETAIEAHMNHGDFAYEGPMPADDTWCTDNAPEQPGDEETGSIKITKYECPADTTVTRSENGVGGDVPEGCELEGGATFGYVHGTQDNTDGPYPELDGPYISGGTTDLDGVLMIDDLDATGRYLISETDDENPTVKDDEGLLGLYCEGDADTSNTNDNQELTFVSADETAECVAYNMMDDEEEVQESVKVYIYKYLDNGSGSAQVTDDAGIPSFPMISTWMAANLNDGASTSGNYVLGNNEGGTALKYAAQTTDMDSPADYTTSEITGGDSIVVADQNSCAEGKYYLVGYKWGNTLAQAEGATLSSTAPDFQDISVDKHVIVVNNECPDENEEPIDGSIHIFKYVDGERATPGNANNASFPMFTSTYNASFTLDNDGWTNGDEPYEASTSTISAGGSYTANEDLSTSLVGASCDEGKPYALVGYSKGTTLAEAEAATKTTSAPNFTIDGDGYMIVWNEDCTDTNEGSIEITKYSCPSDTTVTRSENGVDGEVPEGCELESGETFGYVHGSQTDANGPYPELDGPFIAGGSTDSNGVLTISDLDATGRYLVVETDDEGNQMAAEDILGLYCEGDADTSDTNDNQELTFVSDGETVNCVAYNFENEDTGGGDEDGVVHIFKYIDGERATPTNAENTSFPMFTSTYNAPFTLDNDGWTTGDEPYEASTSTITAGGSYTANEDLTTSTVGESCDEGKPYILKGYTTGSTVGEAEAGTPSMTAPTFTIDGDAYMIVWNEKCGDDNSGGDDSNNVSSSSSSGSRRRNSGSVLGASTDNNNGNNGQVLGESTSCGVYSEKFLRFGYQNDPEAVLKVQRALNLIINAGLVESGVYDQATMMAVARFQAMNPATVLAPWGINAPTGIFYLTTQTQLNNTMCPTLSLPIPSPLINFSENSDPRIPRRA